MTLIPRIASLRRALQLALLGFCAITLASPAYAMSTAYSFQTALVSYDTQLSFGFEFRTAEAVAVYALGYYDDGGDGFSTPHTVGIFDSGGTLLTSVLLGTGTADPLIGDFRYHDIAPLILPAGQSFTIAATSGGPADWWAYGAEGTSLTGFVTDPAIQISPFAGVFVYQSDDVLRDPTEHFKYTVYAGPNFLLTPVPEPGTGILFGSVILSLLAAAKLSRTPKGHTGELQPPYIR